MSLRRLSLAGASVIGAALALLAPVTAHADSGYAVYTGYADLRTPVALFPNPWPDQNGRLPANVALFGTPTDAGSVDPDISGVRIDNTSGGALVVNDVSVHCLGVTFDLGGPGAAAPLAAGDILIDVGTTPLDGSEVCGAPVTVAVTVDSVRTVYADTGAAHTTLGSAIIGAAINGSESAPWALIGGGGGSCITLSGCIGSSAGAGVAIASAALVVFVGAAGFAAAPAPHPIPATAHAGAAAHAAGAHLASGSHAPAAPPPPPPPPPPPSTTHLQEEAGDKLLEAGGSGLELGAQTVEERAALEADASLGVTRIAEDEDDGRDEGGD